MTNDAARTKGGKHFRAIVEIGDENRGSRSYRTYSLYLHVGTIICRAKRKADDARSGERPMLHPMLHPMLISPRLRFFVVSPSSRARPGSWRDRQIFRSLPSSFPRHADVSCVIGAAEIRGNPRFSSRVERRIRRASNSSSSDLRRRCNIQSQCF